MRERHAARGCLLVLSWAGLAVSVYLIYMAVWFHHNLDAIIRIPFVFISGVAGLMLGLSCLVYIVKGHFTGMAGPFS